MHQSRWIGWALRRPPDEVRLAAWLWRQYQLSGKTAVSTKSALRRSPLRRAWMLDDALRVLAGTGAVKVFRQRQARWIEFDPRAIAKLSAEVRSDWPDLYKPVGNV